MPRMLPNTRQGYCLFLTLAMGAAALSTQNFSNFKHDCAQTFFSANDTTLIGTNCKSGGSTATHHQSHLNLDLCLSYDAPNLVAHQGYIDKRASIKYN